MSAKFKALTPPNEGYGAIYVYKIDSTQQNNLTRNVDYSIHSEHGNITRHKLRKDISHAHQFAPGKMKFIHHNTPGNDGEAIQFNIVAGDTLFIQLKMDTVRKGSIIKVLGRSIRTANQDSPTYSKIVEFLRGTRTEYFHGTTNETIVISESEEARLSKSTGANTQASKQRISSSRREIASLSESLAVHISKNNVKDEVTIIPRKTVPAVTLLPTIPKNTNETVSTQQEDLDSNATPFVSLPTESQGSDLDEPKESGKIWPGTEEVSYSTSLDQSEFTCEKPFVLTQGCSRYNLASKKIDVDGIRLKASSNHNGSVIYIAGPQSIGNAAKQFFTFGAAKDEQILSVKNGIASIKRIAQENNITLVQEIRITELGNLKGYLFEAKGNLFNVLQQK